MVKEREEKVKGKEMAKELIQDPKVKGKEMEKGKERAKERE